MIPTNVILDRMQELLATDDTTLSSAIALKVHLISANFTPGAGTDFTTLTEATFTGAGAKAAGIGDAQIFTDPVTGRRQIQLLEPAGGWHWKATDAVGLPQTIYGFCVTDNASLITYGATKLDTPIVLNAANDAVDIPYVRFSMIAPVLA